MKDKNGEIHIDDDEAMAGEKTGVMRYVLGISLLLALVAMSAVWIIPAMFQGDVEEEATVSGEMRSSNDDDRNTDSIVISDANDIEGTDDAEPALVETSPAE